LYLHLADLLAQTLSALTRILQARVNQNHYELFPAITAGNITAASPAVYQRAEVSQQEVSRRVTMAVIELLEVIQVHHEYWHLSSVSCSAVKFPVKGLLHVSTVEEAG
jgi:hypothetical protein